MLAALAWLVTACNDSTPTPLGYSGPATRLSAAVAPSASRGADVDFRDRFDIDVEVHGSLKPGHPIQLSVTGRANYATVDAEIRLTLPEVAAAKQRAGTLCSSR